MPRVKLFDKEKAMEKAMELFWEKGYTDTSLSDLTTHLGIGKGSFYDTFKSKQALFDASFEMYRAANVAKLENILDSEPTVKVGLQKLMEYNVEVLLGNDKQKGCFIANTCSEVSGENKMLLEKIVTHYGHIEQVLLKYLERGKIPPPKAKAISQLVLTFLIGLSQQSKYKRDKEGYLKSIKQLLGLLN